MPDQAWRSPSVLCPRRYIECVQIASRSPEDAEIARLAGLMLARTDELTDLVLNRVAEELPLDIGMIDPDALHATIKDHIHFVFEPITRDMPPDAGLRCTRNRHEITQSLSKPRAECCSRATELYSASYLLASPYCRNCANF